MLVILSGSGLVQADGGPVRPVGPGDIVRFAPGERHWHGATPGNAMTHLAVEIWNGARIASHPEEPVDATR